MLHKLMVSWMFCATVALADTPQSLPPQAYGGGFLSQGDYDFELHYHGDVLGMIFPDDFQNWLWIVGKEGNFAEVWKACESFQGPQKEDYRLPTRTWVKNAELEFLKDATFWISGCTPSGCNTASIKNGKLLFGSADPEKQRYPVICSSGSNSRRHGGA